MKKKQIKAPRIVSGVTRSISLNTLYNAISWLTLDDKNVSNICVHIQN